MWFVSPQESVNTKHYPFSNHFLIKFSDMVGLFFVSLSEEKGDFPIISQPMREMVMVRGVITIYKPWPLMAVIKVEMLEGRMGMQMISILLNFLVAVNGVWNYL